MKASQVIATAAALAAGPASAQKGTTMKVDVGKNGLTFSPDNIQAQVGTEIEFSFFPGDHSVAQGSFSDPCHPVSGGGFFSGFMPTSSTTFTITVNTTDPIYFYCSQTGHCPAGMVGAINAPSSGNTLAAYSAAAKKASSSSSPSGGATGGVLSSSSSSASGSSSASASSPTTTSSSSGSSGGGSGWGSGSGSGSSSGSTGAAASVSSNSIVLMSGAFMAAAAAFML